MGGSGESVAQNQSIPTTSPDKKQDKAGDTMGALKSLADSIKPKEAPEATQYKSFTVDDNSTPIKDVMSARREALMKIMGGK
jgi:flagellar hook-basal body complex protein FliE